MARLGVVIFCAATLLAMTPLVGLAARAPRTTPYTAVAAILMFVGCASAGLGAAAPIAGYFLAAAATLVVALLVNQWAVIACAPFPGLGALLVVSVATINDHDPDINVGVVLGAIAAATACAVLLAIGVGLRRSIARAKPKTSEQRTSVNT